MVFAVFYALCKNCELSFANTGSESGVLVMLYLYDNCTFSFTIISLECARSSTENKLLPDSFIWLAVSEWCIEEEAVISKLGSYGQCIKIGFCSMIIMEKLVRPINSSKRLTR